MSIIRPPEYQSRAGNRRKYSATRSKHAVLRSEKPDVRDSRSAVITGRKLGNCIPIPCLTLRINEDPRKTAEPEDQSASAERGLPSEAAEGGLPFNVKSIGHRDRCRISVDPTGPFGTATDSNYSACNTAAGATLLARKAGMRVAIAPVPMSTPNTASIVTGSAPLTP